MAAAGRSEAAVDGEVMQMKAVLGSVVFDVVESEEPSRSATVTENPVERGVDIADHVHPRPISFSITGVFTERETAPQYLEQLARYWKDGEVLTYIGRNLFENMVIESLDTTHTGDNSGGFGFSITLKQVRIVTPQTAEYVAVDPAIPAVAEDKATAAQAKPVENKGTQQPVVKPVDDAAAAQLGG